MDDRGDTVLSSVAVELERVVFAVASNTLTPSTAVSAWAGSTTLGLYALLVVGRRVRKLWDSWVALAAILSRMVKSNYLRLARGMRREGQRIVVVDGRKSKAIRTSGSDVCIGLRSRRCARMTIAGVSLNEAVLPRDFGLNWVWGSWRYNWLLSCDRADVTRD